MDNPKSYSNIFLKLHNFTMDPLYSTHTLFTFLSLCCCYLSICNYSNFTPALQTVPPFITPPLPQHSSHPSLPLKGPGFPVMTRDHLIQSNQNIICVALEAAKKHTCEMCVSNLMYKTAGRSAPNVHQIRQSVDQNKIRLTGR